MFDRITKLFNREPQLSTMISNLERQRDQVAKGAEQLAAYAKQKQEQADRLAARAAAQTADAERAARIATRIADLVK